jgi:hypothetical protein
MGVAVLLFGGEARLVSGNPEGGDGGEKWFHGLPPLR